MINCLVVKWGVIKCLYTQKSIYLTRWEALAQWFLTGGDVNKFINFQEGANLYAPYNMESFINKFTNKYICLGYTVYLKSAGLETKNNCLGRRDRKKVKNHCSSVYVYQLHTSISRSRIGPQHDPLLICAKVSWKACFGSRGFRGKSLLGFDWTCVGVHHKRVNI